MKQTLWFEISRISNSASAREYFKNLNLSRMALQAFTFFHCMKNSLHSNENISPNVFTFSFVTGNQCF